MNKNLLRKIIGWFLVVVVGAPTLFGTIWAVGFSKAITSPTLIAEVPKKIVQEFPDLLDVTFIEAQKPGAIKDENIRLWVDAAANVETTPRELLEETGVIAWSQTELVSALDKVGSVMRGVIPAEQIMLDVTDLKAAVNDSRVDAYYREVVQNLPDCGLQETNTWRMAISGQSVNEIPACNPGTALTNQSLQTFRVHINRSTDTIPIAENIDDLAQINISRTVVGTTSLTFLIPALVFLLGVFMATYSLKTRLRIIGLVLLVTAVLAYLLAEMAIQGGLAGLVTSPSWVSYSDSSFWSPQLQQFVISRMGNTIAEALIIIFDPVTYISKLIIAVGLVFLGISFIIAGDSGYKAVPVKDPVFEEAEMITEKPKTARKAKSHVKKPIRKAASRRGRPPQKTAK